MAQVKAVVGSLAGVRAEIADDSSDSLTYQLGASVWLSVTFDPRTGKLAGAKLKPARAAKIADIVAHAVAINSVEALVRETKAPPPTPPPRAHTQPSLHDRWCAWCYLGD